MSVRTTKWKSTVDSLTAKVSPPTAIWAEAAPTTHDEVRDALSLAEV
ncbi:MAG: hypothetical protein R3B13_29955 [Polyangiaceae bacterium]